MYYIKVFVYCTVCIYVLVIIWCLIISFVIVFGRIFYEFFFTILFSVGSSCYWEGQLDEVWRENFIPDFVKNIFFFIDGVTNQAPYVWIVGSETPPIAKITKYQKLAPQIRPTVPNSNFCLFTRVSTQLKHTTQYHITFSLNFIYKVNYYD